MTKKELIEELRRAFILYYFSEGCGCCADRADHEEAANRIRELLGFDEYEDGSGHDFVLRTEK